MKKSNIKNQKTKRTDAVTLPRHKMMAKIDAERTASFIKTRKQNMDALQEVLNANQL